MDQFTRDGLTFDLRDGGPPAGDPVLLLHGFPQGNECWDDVAPRLHTQGLRTLAPDLRGYSPRARPTARSAYRLSEAVKDVLALLDSAGLPAAHIVGHDWGGSVAWLVAGHHPDRVRSLTVLSTPHSKAFARALRNPAQLLQWWYMLVFQLPLVPDRLLPRTMRGPLVKSGLPAEYAARYTGRMSRPGAMTGALNWYRAIPWSVREPTAVCHVPTTYVWGRNDPALRRAAAEQTAQYVHASYRFVELDAGHWLPETQPRRRNRTSSLT